MERRLAAFHQAGGQLLRSNSSIEKMTAHKKCSNE